MLSLALLGPFQATFDDRPLTQFNTTKAQALLIYLAVERERIHQREALMALLWPGLPLESAQQSLRQTLYRLRQVIEPQKSDMPFILAERFTLTWNPDAPTALDVAQFEALSGLGRSPEEWQQAANLYRGEFLADFYVTDSETFEEWALNRRAAYHRTAQALLHRLADHYLSQNAHSEAESAVRRSLEMDYFQETAHRQLLQTLAASGRRQEALLHFDTLRRRLREEFNLEPEPETADLITAIRQQKLPVVPKSTLPDANLPEVGNNLPSPPTPFIGREVELSALNDLMSQEDGRLVTIVGPGGMGKTRLALAWAANQIHRQNGHSNGSQYGSSNGSASHPYRHGINFVNLAPLTTADMIIPTLANTLNFPLQKNSDRETRTPRQQILDYLCQKQMLLLFDNFEHLIEGAEIVVDILEAAANVNILVTSRERLNLRQEQVYPIQGLEFPDWETPEDAAEYTAVQLFLQSAQRNQPDFALTDDDLTYLARICRLVAGMPLAIELAAAWVEVLSLQEIAAEIQQGLDILETEMRDVPPRQRSIRATLDYSWHKLTEDEQEIFIRLAVFRGGFAREAAQTVTGASLRQLSRLQNKSLLQVGRTRFSKGRDGHRYQLHELLRQYAAEKLDRDSALTEAINGRHAHYYAKFLADQESRLYGPEEVETLRLLDMERDNIDAAWQWLVDHKEIQPLLDAMNSLYLYYDIRVRVKDGLARCGQIINWCSAPDSDQEKLLLIRALNVHAYLNLFYLYDSETTKANLSQAAILSAELAQSSDMALDDDLAFNEFLSGHSVQAGAFASEQAVAHYEAALRLFYRAGNLRGLVMTLQHLAANKFYSFDNKGGYKVALELGEQALKVARIIKSAALMTDLVAEIGTIALQAGDIPLMKTLMVEVEKALVRLKETGSHFEPERLLERYAWMLSVTGDREAALSTQLEFQALRRELGVPIHAITEFQYGHMLAHFGRYAEAQSYYDSSLALARQSGFTWIEGLNLILIGMNSIATGQLETAESVLQQGLVLQDEIENGLDRAGNLGNLGLALCRLGKYDQARETLLAALEIIVSAHGYLPLIETLPGIALVLAYSEPPQEELAVEIYGMLQTQSYYTNSRLFAEMSGRFLQEVVDSLPAGQTQAALERGRGRELWAGTADLLTTLQSIWQ